MHPDLSEALVAGKHFGEDGSLSLVKRFHSPEKKNPFIWANVHYTVAGYLYASKGFANKLRAVYHLYRAKKLLEDVDIELQAELSVIHMAMACFAKWAEVKRKLGLGTMAEKFYVLRCHLTLSRLPISSPFKALGLATLLTSPFYYSDHEKDKMRASIRAFCQLNEHTDNTWIAQVMCRGLRACGYNDRAREVAERFGLQDQLTKIPKT